MFVKYNSVLRGLNSHVTFLEESMTRLCAGNRYVTTTHTINSLVVKLGKLSRAVKVYRGVSNAVLPDEFWTANEVRAMVPPPTQPPLHRRISSHLKSLSEHRLARPG